VSFKTTPFCASVFFFKKINKEWMKQHRFDQNASFHLKENCAKMF
jgi:hypothetical protein